MSAHARAFAFALFLPWACFAAPTPHPQNDAMAGNDQGAPDTGSGALGQEETCVSLGGGWSDDSCNLDFSAANDGEVPADPDYTANNGGVGPRVAAVDISGEVGAFNITVELTATEAGCDDYIDWWEIVTPTGDLTFRQVFQGPHEVGKAILGDAVEVDVSDEAILIVRGHMSGSGYGDHALVGSVKLGFTSARMAPDFAGLLAAEPPLPPACN